MSSNSEFVKRLKSNKKNKRTRIKEESVDHGKDPYLLLVLLTIMLFLTSPLAKIDYRSVCVWEDELNDLIRVDWMTLSGVFTSLKQLEDLNQNE